MGRNDENCTALDIVGGNSFIVFFDVFLNLLFISVVGRSILINDRCLSRTGEFF